MTVLKVVNATKRFGGVVAVNCVNLEVRRREILGLIGPNGAGKTTLFNLIAGAFPPSEGDVLLEDQSIARLSANRICALGLARTFQIPQIFTTMTVEDSIATGALLRQKAIGAARERAREMAEIVGLGAVVKAATTSLTNAQRKRLEVGRALASGPSLLLLDEVMAGLNAAETTAMLDLIRRLRDQSGLTIILVEHNLSAVMDISDRLVVLESGRKIADGAPEEVIEQKDVIEAYLGAPEGDENA